MDNSNKDLASYLWSSLQAMQDPKEAARAKEELNKNAKQEFLKGQAQHKFKSLIEEIKRARGKDEIIGEVENDLRNDLGYKKALENIDNYAQYDSVDAVNRELLNPLKMRIAQVLRDSKKLKVSASNNYVAVHLDLGFFKHHVSNLIALVEGKERALDKAHDLVLAYAKYIETGDFKNDYIAKTNFGTNADWIAFIDMLCDLRLGLKLDPSRSDLIRQYLTAYIPGYIAN